MTGFSDISERFLLDMIYELCGAACWVVNKDGGVFWDDRLYDLYDMTHGEGINMQAFQDKVYPSDLEVFNGVISEAMELNKPFEVNVRIDIKNRYKWVRIVGAPNSKGDLLGVTQDIDKIFRDTHDTKQLLSVVKGLAFTGSKAGEIIGKLLQKNGY